MFRLNSAIRSLLTVIYLTIIVYSFIAMFGYLKLTPKSVRKRSLYSFSEQNLLDSTSWLIDLPHFRYLMNSPSCFERRVHILALVPSAPGHRELRDAIRQSWGGEETAGLPRITVVFLLGTVEDHALQKALESENLLNGDLVQGSFVDTYRNLTYKIIMGLKWATVYCPQAEVLLKIDDDIFVHMFHLATLLSKLHIWNSVSCLVARNKGVIRDRNSKWYVSRDEYLNGTYPDYCIGWAYLTDISVAERLVEVSQKFPYFWVEDVHITGSLRRAAGVVHRPINRWITVDQMSVVQWTNITKRLDWNYIFGWNWGNGNITIKAHQKALSCQRLQCACCFC